MHELIAVVLLNELWINGLPRPTPGRFSSSKDIMKEREIQREFEKKLLNEIVGDTRPTATSRPKAN